jgi:hypothetical protein
MCMQALEYMHDKGCAHRDIKAENVLCVDKKGTQVCTLCARVCGLTPLQVKLADFGLANALGEASKFQSCVGTTDYSECKGGGRVWYALTCMYLQWRPRCSRVSATALESTSGRSACSCA